MGRVPWLCTARCTSGCILGLMAVRMEFIVAVAVLKLMYSVCLVLLRVNLWGGRGCRSNKDGYVCGVYERHESKTANDLIEELVPCFPCLLSHQESTHCMQQRTLFENPV